MTKANRTRSAEGSAEKEPAEAVRELVLKAREGDLDAAYDVLGRPLPVDTWVKVLRQLAKKPASVELEIVAHRTLRRPAAVVFALLELARAAQSPVAAFLARAVPAVRTEEELRANAESLNGELAKLFDVKELLKGGDAMGALYALLAHLRVPRR